MANKLFIFVISFFLLGLNMAHADWMLDGQKSRLSFGSIKKNSIGESNHFQSLQGRITENGRISLMIKLSRVETWVDIRNERMKEFLFQVADFPMAILTGQVDMAQFEAMKIGDQQPFEVAFDLDLHGEKQTIEAELVILRLSENSVLVIPDEIIFLDLEKFNLLSGVKKLQELAKLPSISSTVPVSFHLTFTRTP